MTEQKKSESKKLTPDAATLEVCRLRCRGMTREQIVDQAKAEKWGLTAKVLDEVIERATDRLTQIASVLNLDTEVGTAVTRLESLYNAAIEAKDIKTALAVEKERIAMLRLREHARHSGKSAPAVPANRAAAGRLIKFSP
jgi:tagatose-1,6-bisphosphate aldolase